MSTLGEETTVRVIAPANLDEGYQFDVLVYGKPYTVTVPLGGVTEGEEFDIPYDPENAMVEEDDVSNEEHTLAVQSSSQDAEDEEQMKHDNAKVSLGSSRVGRDSLGAPIGRWRFRICACCDVLTQATFWMALCCAPVLLAQLLTRLHLNWTGRPAKSGAEASLTFNRIVMSFVLVLFLGQFAPGLGQVILGVYVFLLLLFVGSHLRRTVREHYAIKHSVTSMKCCCCCAKDCCLIEDALCMSVCGCCSLIQMARQTHDDKEYPGYCCTTTGLELGAPVVPILTKKNQGGRKK